MLFRVPTGVHWNSWLPAFSKALSLGVWCQGQGSISTSHTDADCSTEQKSSGGDKLKWPLPQTLGLAKWHSSRWQFPTPGPWPEFTCFTISKDFISGAAHIRGLASRSALRWDVGSSTASSAGISMPLLHREPKGTESSSRWVWDTHLLRSWNSLDWMGGEQACFLPILKICLGCVVEGKWNHVLLGFLWLMRCFTLSFKRNVFKSRGWGLQFSALSLS